MIELSPAERRALRARAHQLRPVVMVGEAGLTQPVLREIDTGLKSQELIKIKVLGDDRARRERLIQDICGRLEAGPVQIIGKILVVYRPRPDAETNRSAVSGKHKVASKSSARRT